MKQQFKTRLTVLLMILSVMLLCLGLAACTITETYTVTVSATTNGTITLSPEAEGNKYEENAKVEVTVTPAQGYEVDTFTVSTDANAALTEGKYTLTVTADTTISATFKETSEEPPAKTTYTVTVSETTNGTITLSPEAEGNKYEENAKVEITVTPAQGYEVDTFTVSTDKDAALTEGKYTLTVTADTTITATFKETSDEPPVKNYYTVTTNYDSEQGTVTLSPAPTDGKYEEGTEVTVAVKASEGYELDAFSVSTDSSAALDNEGQYLLTVSADTTISATFKAVEVAVESVTLNKEELTVHITKEDSSLVATVLPENATTKTVTWKSEAEDVVSVDANGKITAVGAGSAKITATVGDKSATCTVTVTDHELEIKSDGETGHHAECSVEGCGYVGETVTHTLSVKSDGEDGHHSECSVEGCGYTSEKVKHELSDWYADDNGHYMKCESGNCDYRTVSAPHSAAEGAKATQVDGTHHQYSCEICTALMTERHMNEWHYTDSDHYFGCSACGYDTIERTGHQFTYKNNGDTHTVSCSSNCGFTRTESHNLEYSQFSENPSQGHKVTCKNDCGYDATVESHDQNGEGGACSKCGYKDAGEHTCKDDPESGYYDGVCDICGKNINNTWTFTANTGTITKYNGEYARVRVPVTIDGIDVTSIGTAFMQNATITDIIIPAESKITTLSASSFNTNVALNSIAILSKSITTLPIAFAVGCAKLSYVVLSSSITTININAFAACSSLKTVYFLGDEAMWGAVSNQDPTIKSAEVLYYKAENGSAAANEWHWEVEGVIPKKWE